MHLARSQTLRQSAISRRRLVGGAIGAAAALALPRTATRIAAAQSMDPFTYIMEMTPTTDLGQRPGQPAAEVGPVDADGAVWDAYVQLPIKEGQDFHFTCEFDSAWILLNAYGHEVTLEQQLEAVGHDLSIEPWYEETANGVIVWGGDIQRFYSGDYEENFLARARSNAMRKVFESVGLGVSVADTRELIEAALLRGEPVFFKSTVDFLDWVPATWITPQGDTYPVVLGNDHALIVMGFNAENVIIRDPLGPTSTNDRRPWQYTVSWERYLQVLAAQGNDGIAIAPKPAKPA
ncbi:MAG TPA: C39 family peptidase [Thermomicrobiales bacterium]|nr:C39 family peptidase [Thermomicrobiales bacterium]